MELKTYENTNYLGPVGPPGLPGCPGRRGNVGPAGSPGPIGPPGPAGCPGPAGDIGIKGPKGFPGPLGPQGIQGPCGDAGAFGLRGPADGEVGCPGPVGLKGSPGPAGPDGPGGIQGNAGIQGRDGLDGQCGPPGVCGEDGVFGEDGLIGCVGDPGDVGEVGFTGNVPNNFAFYILKLNKIMGAIPIDVTDGTGIFIDNLGSEATFYDSIPPDSTSPNVEFFINRPSATTLKINIFTDVLLDDLFGLIPFYTQPNQGLGTGISILTLGNTFGSLLFENVTAPLWTQGLILLTRLKFNYIVQ